MPSPDTIATILIVAATLLATLWICRPESGTGSRYMAARRYHRAGLARHTVKAIEPAPMSALETVPDAALSPFAAKSIA